MGKEQQEVTSGTQINVRDSEQPTLATKCESDKTESKYVELMVVINFLPGLVREKIV